MMPPNNAHDFSINLEDDLLKKKMFNNDCKNAIIDTNVQEVAHLISI